MKYISNHVSLCLLFPNAMFEKIDLNNVPQEQWSSFFFNIMLYSYEIA
jgi:plasmid rolling circle replication initiator protein Rep